MPVRSPEYPTTTAFNPEFQGLKQFDILVEPDLGGRYEDSADLNSTLIIAQPIDRISPIVESDKGTFIPFEVSPNLGQNSSLKKTGWNQRLESDCFFTNYIHVRVAGESHEMALRSSLTKLEANIRTFAREYIQFGLVLPHLLAEIKNIDGQDRLVSSLDGQPITDKITAEERNGAVLDASISAESHLVQAKGRRRFTVINNPPGWTGMRDQEGKWINYKNHQAMVSWQEAGLIYGLTLVTDLNQDQARQLALDLEADENLLSGGTEVERVANIVRNPARLSFPKSDQNLVQYVLDKILAIRGMGDIHLRKADGTIDRRPVQEIFRDVERIDELLSFNQDCELAIQELNQFTWDNADNLADFTVQEAITKQIELTIFKMTKAILNEKEEVRVPDNVIYFPSVRIDEREDFSREIAYLESIGGCNGGGDALELMVITNAGLEGLVRSRWGGFGRGRRSRGRRCLRCGKVNLCTKTCYKCQGSLEIDNEN